METTFNLPNGEKVKSSQAPAPLIHVLEKNKLIKNIGKAKTENLTAFYDKKEIKSTEIFALDSNAQKILMFSDDFSPELGDNSVLISKEFAEKLTFETNSLIGETLKLGKLGAFRIEQIIELDDTLSIKPDVIVNFDPIYTANIQKNYGNWYDTHLHLFVELAEQTQIDLNQIVIDNAPQIPGAPFTPDSFINLSMRNITNLHYDLNYPDALGFTFSKSNLYLIYSVCAFSFILGGIGFVSSVISIQVSEMERTKTLLSIGGSPGQIIISCLMNNKAIFIVSSALSLSIFYFFLKFFSDEFNLLKVIDIYGFYAMAGAIIIIQLIVYVLSTILVSRKIISLKNSENITKSTGFQTLWLIQLIVFIQMFITALVVFISVAVTYELFSAKGADYGYNLDEIYYTKLDGFNDRDVNSLRDRLNATYGRVTEASSWYPFDKSSNYITVSTAQQKIEEEVTPINYFYAGEKFVDVLGLKVISASGQVDSTINDDSSKKMKVIVTKEFSNLFDNISLENIINHTFYADFGDGLKEIEVVKVVSDFFLGKTKPSNDPIMIIIDDLKANYLLFSGSSNFVHKINLNNSLDFHSSLDTLESEYSDLSNVVFYLLCIVILNIILISLNTVANGLVDVERHSYSLNIMKHLGANLQYIFLFVFKKNIFIYIASATIGVFFGYIVLSLEFFALDNVTFNMVHYSLSFLTVSLLLVFIIVLSFVVVSYKYLAKS
ncbi:hypothetical protein P4S71_06285 [Pseudoalteromonas sp. B62]